MVFSAVFLSDWEPMISEWGEGYQRGGANPRCETPKYEGDSQGGRAANQYELPLG